MPEQDDGTASGSADAGSSGFRPPPPLIQDGGTDGGALDDGGAPVASICADVSATQEPFSKQALLRSIAQCTVKQYCEFEALTGPLVHTSDAYATAPNDATLLAFQTAWYYAMEAWQVAELFRFGPAAPDMELGGQNLRDRLASFPNMARCPTEEQLEKQGYLGDFGKLPSGSRGLGTLEYLLFFHDTQNGCTKYSLLNYPAPGTWAALSADTIVERKRAYAQVAAQDIAAAARTLLDAWDPQKGRFEQEFLHAGKGSTVFLSEQTALNAVNHALFYMDRELKDWKVARPAGLGECTTNCTLTAESLYAKTGSVNARANLKGFRLLFEGCGANYAGLGFDDWLRNVGANDVADRMVAAIHSAEEALQNFDLDRAFVENPASVDAIRRALKAITDILKTDFLTTLNLERPMALEGDND